MKILILHQHFKTPQGGGAIRSYYLAKALVEAGHEVVVISSHNVPAYTIENLEGRIEIHHLPVSYDNRFDFSARASSFMRFAFRAARLAVRMNGIDKVYAISVPLTTGLIAGYIKFRKNIPYYFEVGDLWPDAPVQLGFIKNALLKQALYSLEKSIYKNAEAVVALSPAIQSAIELKVPGIKTHMIPNMADCDFFVPENKSAQLEEEFGVSNKFVVSYIGALGFANGLDYLLECANTTRKAQLPVHFIVCGDGAMQESLKSNAKRLGLTNISFIEFTNRDQVKRILNVTDAAFVCYRNVPILETGSPNKFFDGLASGKLIIINFGGWIRKEIENNQCGIYVDPVHPTDFTRKIASFVNDRKLLLQYQSASRELGERKYSRNKLSKTFRDLFA